MWSNYQSKVGVDIGVDSKQQTLGSLSFPLDRYLLIIIIIMAIIINNIMIIIYGRDLLTALDTYWRKGSNYVQIAIGKNSINCQTKTMSQTWSKRWFTVLAKAAATLLSCLPRCPQIRPGQKNTKIYISLSFLVPFCSNIHRTNLPCLQIIIFWGKSNTNHEGRFY